MCNNQMDSGKIDIFGMNLEKLKEALAPFKVPAFRAKQLADWMYAKGVTDFSEMNNLPKSFREQLEANFSILRAKLSARQDSSDGKTSKFLLAFADGTAVEAVLMRQPYGNSICISTQAGCNMGCVFCASTLHGMVRNLTPGEMLSEVYFINELLKPEGEKVDTMVIMGSGEPLMNYENVIEFLKLCHAEYALNMSYRSITLSTSGIVPGMQRLKDENMPITLSVSLHAPNNELRSELMPINRKYPLAEVVQAAREYADATHRRVTYEYILIDGVNDREKEAKELCYLLKGQLASVNLIPINPVVERKLFRPSKERIDAFENYLAQHHVTVTVRREMGADIQAACGQLRNKHLKNA